MRTETEVFERRPMTREERSNWIRRIRQAQSTDHRCKTCGQPATLCFGDPLGTEWFCSQDFAVQRSRRQREAMRRA